MSDLLMRRTRFDLAKGGNRLNLLYLAVPPDGIELTTGVEAS